VVQSFSDRTAVVTGGASGIGAALASELRQRGAIVVTTDVEGDVDRHLDVRDLDGFRALVADIGVPDLLFANAGISMGGPTHELTRAHWDLIIDVNLNGVVNALLAVYPGMVERGSCRAAVRHAYAATKHAVVGLALGLRSEAALHGVRVSVLCPGAVETPILDRMPADELPATATAPVTARQYLSLLKQKPIAAERFTRLALDGIARNRAIIAVPTSARTLWYLHRMSPSLTDRISNSIARRVDRDLLHGPA